MRYSTLFILTIFILSSCTDKTEFKVVPESSNDFCYGDVCNPETPGEEVCTADSEAPECQAYCQLFVDDPACSNTSELNCETDPFSDGCNIFCLENPYDSMCGGYCEINPGSMECLSYCIFEPNDPDCSEIIDCYDSPTNIACIDFCVNHPSDPVCAGVPDPVILSQTDSFSQSTRNNKVDLLWVIDNSGSMENEQDLLAANFEYFINNLNASNTDFQIGVITTDLVNDSGFLQGSPKIISSQSMTDAQIVAAFINNVKVGVTGVSAERGLKTAKVALQYAKISGSVNFGFLRDNAYLAIVFVSDEDDSSIEDTLDFINFFKTVKGASNLTKVYSIVDDINYGCTGEIASKNAVTLGERYMSVSEELGGFTKSICTTNFASSLDKIGEGILKLVNSFELSEVPLQETLQVRVNGSSIPNDIDSGFIYDHASKSVVFIGSYVPVEGATVTVTYDYYDL